MKPRDLDRLMCVVCGSNYSINYDKANNMYICDDCVEMEEEELEAQKDKDEEEEG